MDLKKLSTDNLDKIETILSKYGVAILENYFTDSYADDIFNEIKRWMIDLNIGLTDDENSWISKNTPLGPRYGMYQSIVSNAPVFWDLRKKIYPIFSKLLNNDELITSVDGASIYPAKNMPAKKQDWAHIDQTESSDFLCYQSQFVATDTTASFVCTPKSHLHHKQIIKLFKNSVNTKRNWHMFKSDEIDILKKMFNDNYQIPIYAKKGSVIFWDSRTIHSAKYPDKKDDSWRAVFYISMRPKKMFSDKDLKTVQTAAINGLATNHWATTIFRPFDKFKYKSEKVTKLMKNCKKLSHAPNMNNMQLQLIGLAESDVHFLQKFIIEMIDNYIKDKDKNAEFKNITVNTFCKNQLYKIAAYLYLKKMINK